MNSIIDLITGSLSPNTDNKILKLSRLFFTGKCILATVD